MQGIQEIVKNNTIKNVSSKIGYLKIYTHTNIQNHRRKLSTDHSDTDQGR